MEQDLHRLLDELSVAIKRTQEGDEDRAELSRLLEAVERQLQAGESRARPGEHAHLVDALQKAEVRFESNHPGLGEALRRAAQALSAAGI